MALFESYERRIAQIEKVLQQYGISSLEEAEQITKEKGLNIYDQVRAIQPICFENACWAYTLGAALAIKKGQTRAADIAATLGEGLQAFCIPGSVADQRKVGLGHGNLGKMLLEEETECFAFLAGHESFAAAEGAIGIAEKANKVRTKPLRVILNGLGKDAAKIIAYAVLDDEETMIDFYAQEDHELRVELSCFPTHTVDKDDPRISLNLYKRENISDDAYEWAKESLEECYKWWEDYRDSCGRDFLKMFLTEHDGKYFDELKNKLLSETNYGQYDILKEEIEKLKSK